MLAFNDKRRSTQNQLDKNLAEVNSLSKSIGQLMKEGKKEDAETAKARVAEIKETSKALQAEMDKAQEDMTNLLYTIPNVPYDSVPEGVSAEDNVEGQIILQVGCFVDSDIRLKACKQCSDCTDQSGQRYRVLRHERI